MSAKSGIADLPLHGGRVTAWLAGRLERLVRHRRAVVRHYGREALLTRLSDPFWFQALGSVMGMDWHSSGITTSVMSALKRGLNPRAQELGIFVCGGRGRQSRRTPDELRALADRLGLDGEGLVRTSRLTARVDNNAIGDGFSDLPALVRAHRRRPMGGGAARHERSQRLGMRYRWRSPTVRPFGSTRRDRRSGSGGHHRIHNRRRARPPDTQRSPLCRDRHALAGVRPRMLASRLVDQATSVWLEGLVLAFPRRPATSSFLLQAARCAAVAGARDPDRARPPKRTATRPLLVRARGQGWPPLSRTAHRTTSDWRSAALDAAKVGHTDKLDGFSASTPLHAPSAWPPALADVGAAIAHERAISRRWAAAPFDDRRMPARGTQGPAQFFPRPEA
jgi:hypothetical protein